MTKKLYKELGLKKKEYDNIVISLNREPTTTELAMFSVEWSEHCGYPRSRKYLRLFPKTGKYPTLIGEDAGGIIVEDTAIIFKMESHNHPSQIDPKQGAATGVGGIVRDIFTAGVRPIACLDSLRFGNLNNRLNQFIFKGVIDGIQSYGNTIGIPTVSGEIYFNDSYSGNCLVNVMCIGVGDKKQLMRAKAQGIGNLIIYAGSKTGRDGIGGCSVLASAEFKENEEKRPAVQVADPFTEKCLIEATLEAIQTGFVVGIKDMGAAGLTCSTSEMAHAGGVGIDVDLNKVPLREKNMEPWEIMMSESQERMLLCVQKGKEKQIIKIFKKWGLECEIIGKVTGDKNVNITHNNKKICHIPVNLLASAPIYNMPSEKPKKIPDIKLKTIPIPKTKKEFNNILIKLLSSPNIASKRNVFEQYDHMVQTNTIVYPGGDATALRIKDKKWGLAVTTDCNSKYCYLDPYKGAQIAIAEAARNITVAGGDPAGVTDCLNFGNPEKKDRYYYFKNCVKGLADACEFFNLPVISGNVSFYNESPHGSIYPTPTIGMVGIVKDIDRACTHHFKKPGEIIILLGKNREELGGSEYLEVVHNKTGGPVPSLDLELEKNIQQACLTSIQAGIVTSAHDVSEGGLAVALTEMSFNKNIGCAVVLEENIRDDILLFGETQSRIILTVPVENIFSFKDIAMIFNVPFRIIGKTEQKKITIKKKDKLLVDLPVKRAKIAFESSFDKII